MIFLFVVNSEFKSSKSLNPDHAPTLQKKKKKGHLLPTNYNRYFLCVSIVS